MRDQEQKFRLIATGKRLSTESSSSPQNGPRSGPLPSGHDSTGDGRLANGERPRRIPSAILATVHGELVPFRRDPAPQMSTEEREEVSET
jgi:hypothetical protein